MCKKPELLAPAGDLIKLKTAIDYGADAVYIGGKAFSLRVASDNFSYDEMKEGIEYAHTRGKKVYVALNIIAHNKDLYNLTEYLKQLEELKVDGVIVADLGIMNTIKKYAPSLNLHVSTQASITNYETVKFYKEALGATRVVLARELSLEEIKEIKDNNPDLEIECFVHGAMCISYSGRCLLSNYMTGRNSNEGDCAQSCRWKYHLMEEKRPGQYLPVYEDERGTFIFNSKDICMIEHIDKLVKAGVSSFKIEGRVKSEYYVATVVKAYRDAIDDYFNNKPFNKELEDELKKISHRQYTTGFYFGKPDNTAQVYTTNSYVRSYELIGTVTEYLKDTKEVVIEQRNRFFKDDELEILMPDQPCLKLKATKIINEDNEEIDIAPHPMNKVRIPCDIEIKPGSFVRKEKLL
ncbi:MAG: U32 family peptidase [Clostridia bacterium]|nr:U32 family peptidase [Oscillospiraceae bacterium]MBR4892984.1 U32 family peptidase [Clostridia bacterium]